MYKGFNKDMTCRDFQYEEGKTYEEQEAKLCVTGFHACESPFDCFSYYPPGTSIYHEVDLNDATNKKGSDSKRAGKKIEIKGRLGIRGLIEAQQEYVKSNIQEVDGSENDKIAIAGDRGTATVGRLGTATAGDYGAATAGERGAATAGERGATTAGDRGAATAGDYGAVIAGERGAATAGYNGRSEEHTSELQSQ